MISSTRLIGIIVACIACCIYLYTLCPTVYVGDSGELTAAAYTLGIAHPPGYPLLCLTGKIFTWIPVGDIAYRINLLSAFFAAGTIFFLFLLLIKLTNNQFAAASGSLLFAFSQTFWSQANIGKSSYAMNSFFTIVILLCLYLWSERQMNVTPHKPTPHNAGIQYLYVSGLCFGLGLSNHHTLLLWLPLYILFIIYIHIRTVRVNKQKQSKKSNSGQPKKVGETYITVYLMLIFFFILGLALYVYLPLRATLNPPVNWGIPDNVERFVAHLVRKQYGSMSFNFTLPRTLDLLLQQVIVYGKLLSAQFSPFMLGFAMVGMLFLFWKNKPSSTCQIQPFSWLLLGIFILYSFGLIYLINYRITTEEITLAHVFFIPSYLIVAIWISFGISFIMRYLQKYYLTINKSIAYILLLLPLIPLLSNYKLNNRLGNRFGELYGKNILSALPQNAILFSIRDSNNFTLAYQKIVNKQRPDITIYDMSGGLFEDASGGYRKQKWQLSEPEMAERRTQYFNQLLARNNNQHQIFFEIPVEMTAFPGYTLKHDSYFYRVVSVTDTSRVYFNPAELEDIDRYYHSWEQNNLITRIVNFYVREALIDYHFHLGKYYLAIGDQKKAFDHFSRAETIGADFSQVYNNLGTIYYELGKFDLAVEKYKQAIAIAPSNREAYYNLALYYQNIAKNPVLAQFYYQQFESRNR
ncbi:MAG: DUF2723 domain-containing protein [bacterium]|nr:DUF2723 domain-containing protein [bacterium]